MKKAELVRVIVFQYLESCLKTDFIVNEKETVFLITYFTQMAGKPGLTVI